MNRKDLVVLAADKDMEYALKGLLSRPQALGIRTIEVDIRVHPGHDPACAGRGVEYLSAFSEYYHYGLLLFDHEGSGRDQTQPQTLQESLDSDFARSAWGERARKLFCRRNLRYGSGAILLTLTMWLGGKTGSLRFVAG